MIKQLFCIIAYSSSLQYSLVWNLQLFHLFFFPLKVKDQTRTMYMLSKHSTTKLYPRHYLFLTQPPLPNSMLISNPSCFSPPPSGKDSRYMLLCYLLLLTFNAPIFAFQIGSFNIRKFNSLISSEKVCLLQCTNKPVPFLWYQYNWV